MDLNYYCVREILTYLSIEDIMNLEMTNSFFGQITAEFYAQPRKWLIDQRMLDAFPSWVWHKAGNFVEHLILQSLDTRDGNLNRILGYFPNVTVLQFNGMDIYMVPNLPNRLQQLIMITGRLADRCDEWFERIASTLSIVRLFHLDNSEIDVSWMNMRNLKVLISFGPHRLISSELFSTVLENNRTSLKQLLLVDSVENASDDFYRTISSLSNVTYFGINSSVDMNRLSRTFRQQLKYLQLFDYRSPSLEHTLEMLCPTTQLQLLVADCTIAAHLPTLVERIPSLDIFVSRHPCTDSILKDVVDELIAILEAPKRTFTLVIPTRTVSGIFFQTFINISIICGT